MEFKHIDYNSIEYKEALKLRDCILRQPLGMSIYDDPLEAEIKDWHFVMVLDQQIIGTCFYRLINQDTVLMKQVAISQDYQGKHIGTTMFKESLLFLKQHHINTILVHARYYALDFYLKLGFIEYGEPFIEVGMKHYLLSYSL